MRCGHRCKGLTEVSAGLLGKALCSKTDLVQGDLAELVAVEPLAILMSALGSWCREMDR